MESRNTNSDFRREDEKRVYAAHGKRKKEFKKLLSGKGVRYGRIYIFPLEATQRLRKKKKEMPAKNRLKFLKVKIRIEKS